MEAREKEEETTSSNNGELKEEREYEEDEDEDEQVWGTLEELLLVCAVNRHGTKSWESIAKELQKRMKHSSSSYNNNNNNNNNNEGLVSSENCEKKYVHLKRRFNYEDEEEKNDDVLRMVDELMKLRVQELKRQVHRHDVSIVSLQLKVKKLEEERESSKVKEEEEEEEERVVLSDLRIKTEENATKIGEKREKTSRSSPEKVITGDSAENRSCNESNSTNHQKTDNIKATTTKERESSKLKLEPDEPVEPVKNKPVSEAKVSRLTELGESISESRRQQSSDVQSSASLSKKKRRRFRGGGDSGDELEAEEVSPTNKRINVKSQPLIRFLENLRSHKHGSVFQRRLPSQETEKYRNVIRQHMDLDTLQSRLDKGIYCDCHPKFYRDLLLIFTNAVLFYRKSSAEHIAARELRKLVIDEITQKTRKPKIQPRKPDPEPQHLEPVVKKPRSSTTMVVCRRRSSSSMQALSDCMKKGDTNNIISSTTNSKNSNPSSNVENGRQEKIKHDHPIKKADASSNNNSNSNSNNNSLSSKKEKESDKSGGGGAGVGAGGRIDGNLKKLLTKERSNLGNGSLRLSNNNGKKIISKDSNKREKMRNVSKDESSEGERVEVVERKKVNNTEQKQEKGTPIVLKKQGVANFLKRMKQNSPSSQEKVKNNDPVDEDEDQEIGGRKEKMQSVKKAGGNLKKSIIKEHEVNATRRSSGRRGDKEAEMSRRGIGRPPKRKAAMMSGSTPDSTKGGRSGGRDSGEKLKKKPRR